MLNPISMLRPKRKITGMSAILLPYLSNGEVDWPSFRAHVERTAAAGLAPAVNMDTGYANLIDHATKLRALEETQRVLGNGRFVAGAYVGDQPGAAFAYDRYAAEIELIQSYGGIPVIFQSYGLTQQGDTELIDSYRAIANCANGSSV